MLLYHNIRLRLGREVTPSIKLLLDACSSVHIDLSQHLLRLDRRIRDSHLLLLVLINLRHVVKISLRHVNYVRLLPCNLLVATDRFNFVLLLC